MSWDRVHRDEGLSVPGKALGEYRRENGRKEKPIKGGVRGGDRTEHLPSIATGA